MWPNDVRTAGVNSIFYKSVCHTLSCCQYYDILYSFLWPCVCAHLWFHYGPQTWVECNHQILSYSENWQWRLLKCFTILIVMKQSARQAIFSGMHISGGGQNHKRMSRGQGDPPWEQPWKVSKKLNKCVRIVESLSRKLLRSLACYLEQNSWFKWPEL